MLKFKEGEFYVLWKEHEGQGELFWKPFPRGSSCSSQRRVAHVLNLNSNLRNRHKRKFTLFSWIFTINPIRMLTAHLFNDNKEIIEILQCMQMKGHWEACRHSGSQPTTFSLVCGLKDELEHLFWEGWEWSWPAGQQFIAAMDVHRAQG